MKMDIGIIFASIDQANTFDPLSFFAGVAICCAVDDVPKISNIAVGPPLSSVVLCG